MTATRKDIETAQASIAAGRADAAWHRALFAAALRSPATPEARDLLERCVDCADRKDAAWRVAEREAAQIANGGKRLSKGGRRTARKSGRLDREWEELRAELVALAEAGRL